MRSGTMVELFHTKGILGVRGILADLLVSVAEGTTDSLGEANLLAGLEEVLTLEDILWGELTKVLGGRNLTGEEGGGETGTLVHTTTEQRRLGQQRGRRRDQRRGRTDSRHTHARR
jgi:hypothetical protein